MSSPFPLSVFVWRGVSQKLKEKFFNKLSNFQFLSDFEIFKSFMTLLISPPKNTFL